MSQARHGPNLDIAGLECESLYVKLHRYMYSLQLVSIFFLILARNSPTTSFYAPRQIFQDDRTTLIKQLLDYSFPYAMLHNSNNIPGCSILSSKKFNRPSKKINLVVVWQKKMFIKRSLLVQRP
jgi:hypothetical protein